MSSAALDAEPGFKMVEYMLLVHNDSVQVASKANALPPLKGKDVTPSVFCRRPDRGRTVRELSEGRRCHVIFSDVVDRGVSGKSTSTETA